MYAPPASLLKAGGAGLATGVGLFYALMLLLPYFGPLYLILALGGPAAIGYAVGEAVHRASGYRRNVVLSWIAGASVLAGFVVSFLYLGLLSPDVLIGSIVGLVLAVQRVKP